ncbi:homospermidine synthase [Anaeromyxobacter sp. PSR-1]|uniref:homospermidine synthase n=1 Tax=unclassified Anaeromyxobacter TaxID=2620896 RepID=UPI0005E09617|nr:homospermidine synthase [Anaeromyxobacter sp. PSR-1]GAO03446.1 saccharopine dehydrogenase [Anaeromyxobacter sp. PSR-1]
MNRSLGPHGTALLVGAAGGVARALLSVLASTPLGRALAARLDALLLVDARPLPPGPLPPVAQPLPPAAIRNADDLARLVRDHGVDQVVDLSSLDTMDAIRACDATGASYLDTSLEHWPGQAPGAWESLVLRAMPPARPALRRGSFLVGSGMNPGVVNALVFAGIEAFARRAGVAPTPEELRLHAVLFTEEDTTVEAMGAPPPGAFPMTWSPLHCLEELLLDDAIAVRRGELVRLGHRPCDAWYRARCGDRVVEGFVVPHEEVLTLAERLPGQELAFVYRLPPAARAALATAPQRVRPAAWPLHRMYPPHRTALRGRDRVGVLLCSLRFGELWIGYDVGAAAAGRLGTGATQLQVAAGVAAGWAQLGRRRGLHFVEDLDWREHLARVDALLGRALVVHDPHAPPRTLAERRVGAAPAEVAALPA